MWIYFAQCIGSGGCGGGGGGGRQDEEKGGMKSLSYRNGEENGNRWR